MFSLSKTFNDTGNTYSGWSMERNPYIVRTCDAKDFDEDGTPYEAFSGIQATETFSIVHWATGAYASDGFTLAQVPFILAQRTNFLVNYKWPSDGVFPLGLQNQEMVSRILDSVGGKQEVTLWLNTAPENNDTMNDGGLLTFGGKDTENCDRKWTKVVSDSSENWSLTIHSFHFRLPSGETIYHYPDTGYPEAPVSAEISIASPLLTVPLDQYNDIMLRLNATRNEELDLYTVMCDEHDLNKIPSIVINLGHASNSIYYTVPPERLFSREGYPYYDNRMWHNVCALMIVPGYKGEWIIGSRFLPKQCVHYDYANKWISFADPLKLV